MKKARKELKKIPSLKDKELQLTAVCRKYDLLKGKNETIVKCFVFVRNQLRHLLSFVEVAGLRDLEQRISDALKK